MAQRLYLLTIFALSAALLYMQFAPSGGEVGDDLYIVVGGNPPSVAVFNGSKFLGGSYLYDADPYFPMYDSFLYGDFLLVFQGEAGSIIYIYNISDFKKVYGTVHAPSNVSHLLYGELGLAPLVGSTLYIAVSNFAEKRGYVCALDLDALLLKECISVGMYPHAPIKVGDVVVAPTIREPRLVFYSPSNGSLRVISPRYDWPIFVNTHDVLRYTQLSFHMITTDGRYIYGEGHLVEPGTRFAVGVHSHALVVAMDLSGRVVSVAPTNAPPPGLPGLAVCNGKLYATSPVEGLVYVFEVPSLKLVKTIKTGGVPWGAFANPKCTAVYVTDIVGGRVLVIDVRRDEVAKVVKTPMLWPHTVIFVDKEVVEKMDIQPEVKFKPLEIPPYLYCGDAPPS
ncbi:YncE family protein [Pyrobaculum calidifontis]|uniref:YncE family protein n=1 Tax=Pyrobaculum calidifontis (strain DSM 21063 / JCM 11548 / VA1) TaxID=410359 RepID=A3MW73_PYRCJ|nr:hypothetical protein [Pyrobaculum calidifontis]ABO08890.1 conserved hypothetical protein [Pyrobaculum calidifontis JCM 11548]